MCSIGVFAGGFRARHTHSDREWCMEDYQNKNKDKLKIDLVVCVCGFVCLCCVSESV